MRLYTEELSRDEGVGMGQALVAAKRRYYQEGHQEHTAYDEKILEELAFYGLPMYRLNTGSGFGPIDDPFPSVDVFMLEPHADEIVEGLLGADLIGFHLDSYAYNFLDSVCATTPLEVRRGPMEIDVDGRIARAGSFPISIDFGRFDGMASRPAVARCADAG